jgi:hypothetical protein
VKRAWILVRMTTTGSESVTCKWKAADYAVWKVVVLFLQELPATMSSYPEGSRDFTQLLGPGVGYGLVVMTTTGSESVTCKWKAADYAVWKVVDYAVWKAAETRRRLRPRRRSWRLLRHLYEYVQHSPPLSIQHSPPGLYGFRGGGELVGRVRVEVGEASLDPSKDDYDGERVWSATLLQSSAATHQDGLSAAWWYGVGGTIQIAFFACFEAVANSLAEFGSRLVKRAWILVRMTTTGSESVTCKWKAAQKDRAISRSCSDQASATASSSELAPSSPSL